MHLKSKWKWTGAALASDPIDATLTVTPIATVDLAIAPSTYAFGPLDIGVSSVTVSPLTLTNNGNVDVTITKRIVAESNPAGWTAAARPQVSDFSVSDHLFDGTSANGLRGLGGTTTVVTTSAGSLPNVGLWFRLDMPSAIGDNTAREIKVRFDGVAQ